jgi:hypothetical protein
VLVGDATCTQLPDHSFQFAHERLLLIVVPEPERVVSEMVRLVEPGGIVAVEEVDVSTWVCRMEPLLSSGDRILIDTSQRVPAPPGIFVIWDGMGLVAKRVEHIPNSDPPKVVIKSVNPEYQSYERIAEEVNVVGRVVWLARRL